MEWKQVPHFTNYEVSECGLLRRGIKGSNSAEGKLIAPTKKDYGATSYWLWKDSVARQVMSPVLVAEAFLTITDNIHGIAAIDGDLRNSHYSNLHLMYPSIPSRNVVWRTIPFSDGYEVSEFGHVRSKRKRYLLGTYCRLMTPFLNRGYYQLTLPSEGRMRLFFVHQLVLHAFHGPATGDANQCCHNDGVSTNNHFSNLRWGTALDNIRDRERHRLERITA